MPSRLQTLTLAAAIAFAAVPALSAQQSPAQQSAPQQSTDQQPPPSRSSFSLKINSDIVLTNVVVRDKKTGEVVRGLTAKDFTILENGKPQQLSSFDFESVDEAAPLNEATINGQTGASTFNAKNGVAQPEELRHPPLLLDVLRHHFHAAREHRGIPESPPQLHQSQDAARRSGRRC